MYCSHCGQSVTGRFCSGCGARLGALGNSLEKPVHEAPTSDWTELVDYKALLAVPEVRDHIARSAAEAKHHMTGEEFLDLCGKALGKLAGVPLPMSTVARFAQSLHGKLGVKTGKARSNFFALPPGRVLASLLSSLARHGRTLRAVHQLQEGCILVAKLPSDIFALEGDLVITVSRRPGGTHVEAKTEITGQMFDWGKSARCLDALFADITSPAAAA